MHLRRLTLTTFALPLVLASCSSDRSEQSEIPVFTEPMPNQGGGEQPAGSNQMPVDVNGSPNTPSTPAPGGNGESPNPVTELQPGEGTEMGGGAAAGDGTVDSQPVPFNCVLPELPDPQNLYPLHGAV